MNMIPTERILFDNYDRDYKEWLENIPEEDRDNYSESQLQQMFYDDEQVEWQDMMYELNHFDNANKYIIFGSIGRWDGTHSGWNVFDTIEKCIQFAIEDCNYIKIYDTNGILNIHCSHHDGSCSFVIKELTDEGCRYIDNWEYSWNDKRNSKYIGDQVVKRYSRNLNYAHKVWGCKRRQFEKITKEGLIRQLNNQARSFYC